MGIMTPTKNLLFLGDGSYTTGDDNLTFSCRDGLVHIYGEGTASASGAKVVNRRFNFVTNYINYMQDAYYNKFKLPAGTYTVSLQNKITNAFENVYQVAAKIGKANMATPRTTIAQATTNTNTTFTLTQDTEVYFGLQVDYYAGQHYKIDMYLNIQLEKGSTVTDYILPYVEEKIINPNIREYEIEITGGPVPLVPYDKTQSVSITLLERQVIVKGAATDSGKIGIYNVTQGADLAVGATRTLPVGASSSNFLQFYANAYAYSGSQGYTVIAKIQVKQNDYIEEIVSNPTFFRQDTTWGNSWDVVKTYLNTLKAGTYSIILKATLTQKDSTFEQKSNLWGLYIGTLDQDKRYQWPASAKVGDTVEQRSTLSIPSTGITTIYAYGCGANGYGPTGKADIELIIIKEII